MKTGPSAEVPSLRDIIRSADFIDQFEVIEGIFAHGVHVRSFFCNAKLYKNSRSETFLSRFYRHCFPS